MPYCTYKPVYEQHTRECRYTVMRPCYQEYQVPVRWTTCRPVYEQHVREQRYMRLPMLSRLMESEMVDANLRRLQPREFLSPPAVVAS